MTLKISKLWTLIVKDLIFAVGFLFISCQVQQSQVQLRILN
jgi:hypothetical protein